jgi:hypothetical protein
MSETAKSLVSDILQELLVNSAEQSIPSVDFQTGVRYLNRWMAEQDADGVKLGYTEVTNPEDAITVPAGAINGIIYNIALQLSTTYDVVVTPELAIKASSGLDVMIKLGSPIQGSKYTANTPRGSGNYNDTFSDFTFYDGCCEDESAATCGETQ